MRMPATEIGRDLKAVTISSFVASLKACATKRDLCNGIKLHALARTNGLLEKNLYLGNMLIIMYVKCGATAKAQQVLDEMRVRNVFTWSALISGHTREGQGKEALECYKCMQSEGLSPNAITYICILKACGITREINFGGQIHDEIVSRGLFETNVVLGNALVDMYAKCGVIAKAQQVLDEMPVRNVVSWSSLIAGYTQQGQGKEALHCYEKMQREGLAPDAITYACILKACGITQQVHKGKQIHEDLISQGLLGTDVVLGNSLIDMYVKCGAISKAHEVLEGLSLRDAVSWNTLISGYAQEGQSKTIMACYEQMESEGLSPDPITYACMLKALGVTQEANWGEHIHNEVISKGLLTKDAVLGTALIDMYAKCGTFSRAEQVLRELPIRNVPSWNALIGGYSQQGWGEEALHSYRMMQSEGLSPDTITYACTMKACSTMQNTDCGREILGEILSQGLLGNDLVLGNALIDMYANCGHIYKAHQVLDELPIRNVISWNALIAGYAQSGQGKEALHYYVHMQREGMSPDAMSYACILNVCGITQEADRGKQFHDEISSQGLLEREDVVLRTTLVHMYAKCGAVVKANQVLKDLPIRNIVSWNALITGYAQRGQGERVLGCFQQMQSEGFTPDIFSWNALIGAYSNQGLMEEALECFYWMQREGTHPDAITFICVLNAYSHSGVVDNGQTCFESMSKKYGILPEMEHHTCMIDLFSRAGHFEKAMDLIKKMSSLDYSPLWSALLSACQKWGNLKLGNLAFQHALRLNPHDAAPYVLLADVCAAVGRHKEQNSMQLEISQETCR